MIKWIVMDMDGTLLSDAKEILPYTKEILIKAQSQGYRLILASGRPTGGIIEYAKELQMNKYHGLLLSYNGSYVADCQDEKIYYNNPIPADLCKQILHHIKQFDVHAMIDKDEYMFVNDVYAPYVRHESKNVGHNLLCEVKDLEAFCDFPLHKIIVCGEPQYLQAHYHDIAKPFIHKVNSMFTGEAYYEFNALGVHKLTALKAVLSLMNDDLKNVIAFGDGCNDIEMIQHAGIGVAMRNAHEDLKKVADMITDSNEHDGIANTLIHVLSLNE